MDNNTVKAKIQAIISEWLYSGKATWENLINALVKTSVLSHEVLLDYSYIEYLSSHLTLRHLTKESKVWETQTNNFRKKQMDHSES